MKPCLNIFFSCLISAPQILSAQLTFQKYYESGFSYIDNQSYDVKQTSDSGFIFVGSASVNSGDVFIAKTNAIGAIDWSGLLGINNAEDFGSSVIETYDHGYVVTGLTAVNVSYNKLFITKLDNGGNVLWSKCTADSNFWNLPEIQLTRDSGLVVIEQFCTSSCFLSLIKLDYNGDTLWTKLYPALGKGSVKQTKDDGFIILGAIDSSLLIIKTTSTGDIIWSKEISNVGKILKSQSVQLSPDSGFILSGISGIYDMGYFVSQPILIKVDYSGNFVWSKSCSLPIDISYPFWANTSIVSPSKNGTFGLCGTSDISSLSFHGYLIVFDNNGNTIATNRYSDSITNFVRGIDRTFDGGFILSGNYGATVGTDSYSYLLKTDPFGNTSCNMSNVVINIQNFPVSISSININDSTGINIEPIAMQFSLNAVEHTICSTIGIDEIEPDLFLHIYPNPVKGKLTVATDKKAINRIGIYTSTGNTIVDRKINVLPGESVSIELISAAPGIYFVKIEFDDSVLIRKLIIE